MRFDSFTAVSKTLILSVKWKVDSAFATVTDTVKIYNSQGCTIFHVYNLKEEQPLSVDNTNFDIDQNCVQV